MDYEEYHTTLEPVVIINDEETEEENQFFSKLELYRKGSTFKYHTKLPTEESEQRKSFITKLIQKTSLTNGEDRDPLSLEIPEDDLLRRISSEISIFPIMPTKQKSHYKIRLMDRQYSERSAHTFEQNNRSKVRVVSQEEATLARDTYQRRKSNPLEKCPICKKFFRRMKTHLQKHEMMVKPIADPPMCTICHKMFSSQLNLQTHMKTHTGERQYVCDVCHKQFTQSCNLVNHMRIHTGERPFKCPHCDKAFTQSGNLNNHIRLHTDEKPFKCHFCEKAFVQSGNLNSHIKNNHRFELDAGYLQNFMSKRKL